MPNDPVKRMETFPTREAWLAARRRSIGGSDSPKIMGVSHWGTPVSVWADKRGLVVENALESEAVEWGLLLEPLVAARYQRETGLEVEDLGRFTIFRNPEYPFLHVSPDRLVHHPTRGPGLLSIKTTSAYKAEEWSEEVPDAYQVQCQHEMLVMDRAWCAVAVLIGGQIFKYVEYVPRNDRFLKSMVKLLQEFWESVQSGEMPPVDASDACREALKAMYPKDSGETIPLHPTLLETDDLWLEAKRELELWTTQKELCENRMRAALGEASAGVLPGGVVWSNKLQSRKEFVMPATEFRKLTRRGAKKG